MDSDFVCSDSAIIVKTDFLKCWEGVPERGLEPSYGIYLFFLS
jgi:hypothetical protein